MRELTRIDLVAGQTPSLGERDQMLMTVQFPDDFVIADFLKIQEIDLEPGFQRAALAVNRVEMPVDVGAVVADGAARVLVVAVAPLTAGAAR